MRERLNVVKVVRSNIIMETNISVLATILTESVDFIQKIVAIIKENPSLTEEEIVKNYL
ncbi:MAG: hypothetical protein J6B39_01475 [Lachnospiraceae bacterium]|nr:hypothetical protein [Lachnospiraceae bacterium]